MILVNGNECELISIKSNTGRNYALWFYDTKLTTPYWFNLANAYMTLYINDYAREEALALIAEADTKTATGDKTFEELVKTSEYGLDVIVLYTFSKEWDKLSEINVNKR